MSHHKAGCKGQSSTVEKSLKSEEPRIVHRGHNLSSNVYRRSGGLGDNCHLP